MLNNETSLLLHKKTFCNNITTKFKNSKKCSSNSFKPMKFGKNQEKNKQKISFLLKNLEIISTKFCKNLKFLIQILSKLNEILLNYYYSFKPKLKILILIKECIHRISKKLLFAFQPSKSKTYFEIIQDSFLIRINSIFYNDINNFTQLYEVTINFNETNSKKSNLKLHIEFPFSLLFIKNNDKILESSRNNSFLSQTIVWKLNFTKKYSQKEKVISNLFSFDIYNKNTKKKLVFENLSNHSFIFHIPALFPLNKSFIEKNKSFIKCQFWNHKMSQWRNEGCRFRKFDLKKQNLICECNHLTEFRVKSQRNIEETQNNTGSSNEPNIEKKVKFI